MAKNSKKRIKNSAHDSGRAVSSETRVRRAESDTEEGGSLVKGIVIVVLVVLGVYLLVSAISRGEDKDGDDKAAKDETSKVEGTDNNKKETDAKSENDKPAVQSSDTRIDETDSDLSYSVGEGESYTTVARHAIARIGNNLTPAERVAAETKLATDANAELLDIGQEIKLSKDTVRAAIEWAEDLSDEQKVAWQPYADLVAW